VHPALTLEPALSTTPGRAQVAAGLAAWVAATGASRVGILHLCHDKDHRGYNRKQIRLNSADRQVDHVVNVEFEDVGALAGALAAPCSQRGLECNLEQGANGRDAIVMRRMS